MAGAWSRRQCSLSADRKAGLIETWVGRVGRLRRRLRQREEAASVVPAREGRTRVSERWSKVGVIRLYSGSARIAGNQLRLNERGKTSRLATKTVAYASRCCVQLI
jgi:hypothetical protein